MTFFPQHVIDKYKNLMDGNQSLFTSPVDYINESIIGVTIPGISDLIVTQPQISHNASPDMHVGLGKLRVEPKRDQSYLSAENILTKIENTFTVKMRKNQGLYNYFMMYETILHHYDKRAEYERKPIDNFVIDIMNETGSVTTKVILKQPVVSSIEGLEFSYNKIERQGEEFNVTFSYNNIDFEFLPYTKVETPEFIYKN
jgi:hypothetical protein